MRLDMFNILEVNRNDSTDAIGKEAWKAEAIILQK